MARRGGLGKGLGALIPVGEPAPIDGDSPRCMDLPIDSIMPNQHQPRAHFDEESLAELAASIRELGVLQPVLVRPVGRQRLRAGRGRAALAGRASAPVSPSIPAIVRNTDDLGCVERALVENLHRQDLTPLEEAAAYQQLIEDFELTHEQVANRVGKEPLGGHQHAAADVAAARRSNICWPTAGSAPATPGRCSARPTAPCRSNWLVRRLPRTGRCGCSKRWCASAESRRRPSLGCRFACRMAPA